MTMALSEFRTTIDAYELIGSPIKTLVNQACTMLEAKDKVAQCITCSSTFFGKYLSKLGSFVPGDSGNLMENPFYRRNPKFLEHNSPMGTLYDAIVVVTKEADLKEEQDMCRLHSYDPKRDVHHIFILRIMKGEKDERNKAGNEEER